MKEPVKEEPQLPSPGTDSEGQVTYSLCFISSNCNEEGGREENGAKLTSSVSLSNRQSRDRPKEEQEKIPRLIPKVFSQQACFSLISSLLFLFQTLTLSRPFQTMLLLLFLLSASWSNMPTNGEVVHSFEANCPQFFLRETPPVIRHPPRSVRICQRYQNLYRFATLYDEDNRIPVYSAYIYNPGKAKRPKKWMIEPQVRGDGCRSSSFIT